MKNILILTTTSDFLEKFEVGNVQILRDMGWCIHYASNTLKEKGLFDEEEVRSMNIRIHTIDIERSPYMFRYNYKALKEIIEIVKENNIDVIHCHTPVGGLLGRLTGRYFKTRDLKNVLHPSNGDVPKRYSYRSRGLSRIAAYATRGRL